MIQQLAKIRHPQFNINDPDKSLTYTLRHQNSQALQGIISHSMIFGITT